MSMSSGLPPSAVANAIDLFFRTIAPVHGAIAQPIGHIALLVEAAPRHSPSPPSMYGKLPNESMSSCIPEGDEDALRPVSAPRARAPRSARQLRAWCLHAVR